MPRRRADACGRIEGTRMWRVRILAPVLALLAQSFAAHAAPDEELLGKSAGYPIGTRATWFYDERVRVGSFSRLDEILPYNTLLKSAVPMPLPKAADAPAIEYLFAGRVYSIDDFLIRQRVTGFLLIRNGEVIAERYQYDRRPRLWREYHPQHAAHGRRREIHRGV
ncbi:hypothetical protein [Bradyrhizobium sp.]|uniref:hypothetical protein n=1 Tax=Bradyrhizobium sp. TaxID=376 RepID=UPI0040379E91